MQITFRSAQCNSYAAHIDPLRHEISHLSLIKVVDMAFELQGTKWRQAVGLFILCQYSLQQRLLLDLTGYMTSYSR